jgi:hypothetical protein
MEESKTFVSKAIMEDEIKLRQLERSLKLRVKTGCDTCRYVAPHQSLSRHAQVTHWLLESDA